MAQLLMLNYGEQLHKVQLTSNDPKTITIGNQWSDTVTFLTMDTQRLIEWDGEHCLVDGKKINPKEPFVLKLMTDSVYLYLIEANEWAVYDSASMYSLTFGPNDYDEVTVENTSADFLLIREELGVNFKLQVYKGQVYHNYKLVKEEVVLEAGDQLYFDGVLVKMSEAEIQILTEDNRITAKLVPLLGTTNHLDVEYPDYHRSPRIIYRAPEEKLTIGKPSSKPSKPSEQLGRIIVPPLVMVAAMIIVSFFRANGIFLIVMLSMTVVTVIFSITSYIKNVRKYRHDTKERDVSYRDYLKRKTTELHGASEEQRHALNYHYPNVAYLREMALKVDARIYEKTMFHHDFLTYRVGLGRTDMSFDLEFREEEFTVEKDELMDAARNLRAQYQALENVPVVTDLMHGPVGYIGQRKLVLEQLQLLVMQTAVFHSYYDLQFITIFPEEEKEQWDWMRWLPHAKLQDINVRGFVYHERSRDQVLNSFYQILKERKQAIEEKANKSEKLYFTPHYVVLMTDEKMILDHMVMEFFNEDLSELGVSLVFVQEVMQSLPEHVKTVIDIRDAKNGNIILEQGELVNHRFALDHFPRDFDKEDISRALAPLNHLQNLKNSIPESVTFLEMYGVEKVEELGISQRWARNETYKSLAVPLGLRGKDDIVNLNLHEKAHGPHGLVAGTTGSGKSEIIQSYIISLAVNFHPYEVGFLLIDYKGGGMANLFKNLPHLLGTITNLDGAQSMRALASIKAELEKRQRLFGEHDVNHINQYQKLFKQGEASEAMPHLFLISDEFAELKSEQPEFMKELVSTARIGRSLGIHLILATQKPSGVVDDQIWSNSKFKLALKVQNASDSNEILKTPDAAEITLPGRSYLQVGNNEIYELFQSAWSGADYIPEKEDQAFVDTTIYAINDLGQYDILTEDLSGLGGKEAIEKVPTELDAVIEYVHHYTEKQGILPLPRPWLPPLQETLVLSELHEVDYQVSWYEAKKPLIATIGLLDLPEMQAQEPLSLDFTKDGHLAVFSSPGYGKSTFLQSTVTDLVRQHNPERLHIYLIDLGTNGLLPLKEFPHIADTIMIDEVEKLTKLIRRLRNELKERKQKLSKYGVATIDMYERASGEEVPSILLIIDTFDSARDASFIEEFEQITTQISREGASVGIYMAISAGRQNAMRLPLLSNIKNQIALFMIDEAEPRNIVGRTQLGIEEVPGRGLVKIDQPTVFQTALPVNGHETLEVIEGIQHEGKEMKEAWLGILPKPIPMVPEIIHLTEFIEKRETKEMIAQGEIPFAVDMEEVEPMALSVVKDQTTLIVGDVIESVASTFKMLIASIEKNSHIDVGMIDDASTSYGLYRNSMGIYAKDSAEIDTFIEQLVRLYETREDAFKEVQLATDGHATLNDFLREVRPMVVLIPEVSFVIDVGSRTVQENVAKLVEKGARMGIYFVVGVVNGSIDRLYDDISNVLKKQKVGVLLGRIADQSILEVMNRSYKEQKLAPYEAYYIKHGHAEKIKIVAPF